MAKRRTAPKFTAAELQALRPDLDVDGLMRRAPGGPVASPAPAAPADHAAARQVRALADAAPAATAGGKWATVNAYARHVMGRMNGVERRRARELEADRQAGRIQWWAFERVTLRLGNGCSYTADFVLVDADGLVVFQEVKGTGGWLDSAGRVKWQAAAEGNAWARFEALVERKKADREPGPLGRWHVEVYRPCAGFPPVTASEEE